MESGIKEYENFGTNPDSRSLDNVDIAINKFKNHPSIKMINADISFESRFSFKDISQSDMQKEVSNLNSKKAGIFGNIPAKVLKESSNVWNAVLRDIWNFEILEKQFSSKFKNVLKDTTLVENYRPVIVLPVSEVFERIIQKQFSSFINAFLSPY